MKPFDILLVLGFSLLFGGRGEIDRESSFTSLVLIAIATVLFLIPSIPAARKYGSRSVRFGRAGIAGRSMRSAS